MWLTDAAHTLMGGHLSLCKKHYASGGKIMLYTFSLSEEPSTCLMMFWKCLSLSWNRMSSELAAWKSRCCLCAAISQPGHAWKAMQSLEGYGMQGHVLTQEL